LPRLPAKPCTSSRLAPVRSSLRGISAVQVRPLRVKRPDTSVVLANTFTRVVFALVLSFTRTLGELIDWLSAGVTIPTGLAAACAVPAAASDATAAAASDAFNMVLPFRRRRINAADARRRRPPPHAYVATASRRGLLRSRGGR